MSVHDPHGVSRPGLSHACPRNGAPVSAERPATWSERPDPRAARIARKRRAREALAERGESKHEYIAAVLGISRSRVTRCLLDGYPDEFTPEQLERLGLDRMAA